MACARDRLEDILGRLEARKSDERVFTKLYAEAARAAADAADARRKAGVTLGPLDGAVVSIKDLFDVVGEPTLAGSFMRRNAAPATTDAAIVARLRRAGAIILGKTAMTEFAFTAIGDNPHTGTPGNAADPARIPGGSSSGAGVSAAEGTSDIAIGSDTAGSVRIPAALNGVVGFKPTARRVPLAGAFPLSPSLDSIGPLARTVAECAAADAVMSGMDPQPLKPLSLSGLRLGIPRGVLFRDMEAEVEAAFENAISRLGAAGPRIEDIAIEDLLAAMRDTSLHATIPTMEGAEIHADWLDSGASLSVDPHVSGPLSRAASIPAPVYIRALRRRGELAAALDERLSGFDALLLPTVPILAPQIAEMADEKVRDHAEGLLLRNTRIANEFDLCAITLPLQGSALPVGLMLIGRSGCDRRLLAMAATAEEILQA
ncbi:MAG: amidase [Proteobacteria bacterium]|nr:MAG: amidase [Pseudomonadota bacterium]